MDSLAPDIIDSKGVHFLGIARLQLHDLSFLHALNKTHREESEKAKSRLLNVFKLENCRRFDEENFIDAVINEIDFDIALQNAGFSKDLFRKTSLEALANPVTIPILNVPHKVSCLTGLHRIRAAEEYLDKNDKWWVVRLHSSEGLIGSVDVSTRLIESYSHEQLYSDGTIFRMIRIYHRDGQLDDEKRWWARLTDTKRKDLRQLLKHQALTKSFDALLDFSGLWTPIQLGTLHRLHALKCPEELINYLKHIEFVWSTIVPKRLRSHVDTCTVRKLELYAPGISSADADEVDRMMKERIIFPNLIDAEQRSKLLKSITSTTCLIPSLRTFFENQKYIEPCSSILRTLLDDSDKKRSLWLGLSANFFRPKTFLVQCTEGSSKVLSPSSQCQKELGYLQLWMFCLRYFPEMTSIKPKMALKGSKARWEQNPALWQKLATLAVGLGFKTSEALRLAKVDPERECARVFLEAARPYCKDLDSSINEVARVLREIEDRSLVPENSVFTSSRVLTRDRRCGKPYEDDFQSDRSALFVPIFSQGLEHGFDITSLYVKRDILEGFLKSYLLKINLPSIALMDDTPTLYEANRLTRQPTIFKSTIQKLEDELREERDRICLLQQSVNRLEVDKGQLRTENENLRAQTETLQEKLDSVPEDDEFNFGDYENSSTDETGQLKVDIEHMTEMLQHYQNNSEQERAKILMMEQEMKQVIAHRDNLKKRVEASTMDLKLSQERCLTLTIELEKEQDSLKRENERMQIKTLAEQKLEVIERNGSKTSEELASTKLDLQSAENKCQVLESKLLLLEDERDNNTTLLASIKQDLEKKCEALKSKVQLLENERDKTIETNNATLQKRLAAMKQNLEAARKENKVLEKESVEIRGERERLENTVQGNDVTVQGHIESLALAKQELETIRKEKAKMTQEIKKFLNNEKAQSQKSALETTKLTTEAESAALASELEAQRAQQQIQSLETQLTDRVNQRRHHWHTLLTRDIVDPVQYAFEKFKTQSAKERDLDILEISKFPDDTKDHITAFIISGPGSELQTGDYRSMQYSIPTEENLLRHFMFYIHTHKMAAYIVQGNGRNVIKKLTDTESLVSTCKLTGACYFGDDNTMEKFAQRLPHLKGKRRAPYLQSMGKRPKSLLIQDLLVSSSFEANSSTDICTKEPQEEREILKMPKKKTRFAEPVPIIPPEKTFEFEENLIQWPRTIAVPPTVPLTFTIPKEPEPYKEDELL